MSPLGGVLPSRFTPATTGILLNPAVQTVQERWGGPLRAACDSGVGSVRIDAAF